MREIVRIIIHFFCFIVSFYCLSGIDLGKVMLPGPKRTLKGQGLLLLCSLALGYGVAQFILNIMY